MWIRCGWRGAIKFIDLFLGISYHCLEFRQRSVGILRKLGIVECGEFGYSTAALR
jgi:hypothetical protein